MRLLLKLTFLFLFTQQLSAQQATVKWGEEFKLSKKSTGLDIITSDETGVYVEEEHLVLKSYFVIGASFRSSASLIKLDKNFSKIYLKHYNKELKGKSFTQFFALKDDLFIIASEYQSANISIHAAKINKSNGDVMGDWVYLTSIEKDSKKDGVNYKLSPNADSSSIVITTSIEGKTKNEYTVVEIKKDLNSPGKKTIISNKFDPKLYDLEDLIYTTDKRIILVGKVYEYMEGKKKKDKFRDFAHYNIQMYDEKGKLVKELSTSIDGKWLNTTRVFQVKDKIILTAFYSNHRKGKIIDGILVQNIDPLTGKILNTIEKDINHKLLEPAIEKDIAANETSQERKDRESFEKIKNDSEGFSNLMKFRDIYYTDKDEIIIVAEKFNQYTVVSQELRGGAGGAAGAAGGGRLVTTYRTISESGDIIFCKITPDGGIDWMKIIPKYQRETLFSSYTPAAGFFYKNGTTLYSGFASIGKNNYLNLVFNDNPANAHVVQAGAKIKTTSSFANSHCFQITLDTETGNISRKFLFSNANGPIIKPQHTSIISGSIYAIGQKYKMLGKSRTSIGRIDFQ